MSFASFDIRRASDNSVVDIDELDKSVRVEFSLKDHERDKPYGHFCFSESEEELGGFQKSISWLGLIHVVVYYSNINYGKSTIYDLEASLAWVMLNAVFFPRSTKVFFNRLIECLYKRGYYVFVNFHHNEDRIRDEYVNSFNCYKIFRSESGLFECADDGVLLKFYPGIQNLLFERGYGDDCRNDSYRLSIHTLIIPEGVTSFGEDFFRGGFVRDKISFPSTLRSIGNRRSYDVFSDTCLPDLVIPQSVENMGMCAFRNSKIKSVTIQRLFECEYRRQFEDARIGALFLPNESFNQWMLGESEVFVNLRNADIIEFY